ncbi:MAG: hypothetical protein QY309_06890 [Cyclobacteriaceae bacterium]|jgi:hypothetical protein|nr:MAG: hypothetical protein QY309_06890 [Cyclobacteriaceae bacterium]
MKKTLLTLFAAITVFAASAQIEQGTIIINGASSFDFTSYNEDAGDFSEFNVGVKGGYFFAENLAVGLNLSLYKFSEADDAWVGIGPFARYYFDGKIFAGAGFLFEKAGEASASQIPLEVGYAIFLNDAVAIEPNLNYTLFGGDREGGAFGLNVGISVYLGRN